MDKSFFQNNNLSKIDLIYYNQLLLNLEKTITYPLGVTDRFTISHGADYFRFFNRLGRPYWSLLIDSDRVCGQLCATLRKVPGKNNCLQRAWYICDLKKDRKIPFKNTFSTLFRQIFHLLWKCQRGYAVSMNESDSSNRLDRLVNKVVFLPLAKSRLEIFSCSYNELMHYLCIIKEYRGDVTYLSLEGVKDIILKKKGKLPLIHLQFGPLKDKSPTLVTPVEGYQFMWCAPENDPLTKALIEDGLVPTASSTVFSFRMKTNDWSWLLTSDI